MYLAGVLYSYTEMNTVVYCSKSRGLQNSEKMVSFLDIFANWLISPIDREHEPEEAGYTIQIL